MPLADEEHGVDLPKASHEVSLLEISSVLLRQRVFLFRFFLFSMFVSVGVALSRPTRFTSSASFLPEGSEAAPSGALALAQQFGLSVGTGGNERSPSFYADLVTSGEILRQLVTREYSLSLSEEGGKNIDLIGYYEIDGVTEEWNVQEAVVELRRDLYVRTVQETGIVSFSVTTDDPGLSQALAAQILELVNDFDVTTRQSHASAERLFSGERLRELTAELEEAEDALKDFLLENRDIRNSPLLQSDRDRLQRTVLARQELVSSVAQAFEQARIEEVRNIPVITLIESPRVPARRDRKRRVLIVAVGTPLGILLGVFFAFLRNLTERGSTEHDRQMREFSSLWRDTRKDLARFVPFMRSAG